MKLYSFNLPISGNMQLIIVMHWEEREANKAH